MISDRGHPLVPSTQAVTAQQYHYSPGLRLGDFVHTSGQIGTADDGLPLEDPEAQFVAVFERLGDLLALGGCGYEDIVDLMTFHTTFDHFELFTSVKDRFLHGPVFPCWTAIGSELALPGALVEVKCTAVCKPTYERR